MKKLILIAAVTIIAQNIYSQTINCDCYTTEWIPKHNVSERIRSGDKTYTMIEGCPEADDCKRGEAKCKYSYKGAIDEGTVIEEGECLRNGIFSKFVSDQDLFNNKFKEPQQHK